MRPTPRWFALHTALLLSALLLSATRAAATAEESCQKGRYGAASKYAACELKTAGGLFGGGDFGAFVPKMSKCHVRYTASWVKLAAKAAGTGATCDSARFVTPGNGTVEDRLTGLQWEQKTDDASIHDKDDTYTWSAGPPGIAADGTAYTGFLATLNGACFAGHCDWRLPTRAELQTILLEPYPCVTNPCIDTTAFGPSAASYYWTDTTYVSFLDVAWGVDAVGGGVITNVKTAGGYVRAVRGGL